MNEDNIQAKFGWQDNIDTALAAGAIVVPLIQAKDKTKKNKDDKKKDTK